MALLVWLTLNGHIYNYGLSNVIVANNGSVDLTLNGKLGKCATFGSSNYLSATIPNSSNTFSVSWWLYLNSVNTGLMPWGIGKFNPIYNLCLNTSDGTRNPWYVPGTTTKISQFTSGWHHFVVTGDGTTNKLFLDGVHYGNAKTYRALKDYGTSLRISGWPIDGNYQFNNGKISDFRLYDHVLSNQEVHELSRGLVLHYPFNDEYVGSTAYDCSGYCNNGTVTGSLQVVDDSPRYKKCSKFYNTTVGIKNLPNFTDNSISISFWMKPDTITNTLCILNYRYTIGSDLAVFLMSSGIIRFDAGGLTSFTSYQYSTEWLHVVLTYDGSYKRLYINGELLSSAALNSNITINATKGTIGKSSVNTIIDNATNVYRGKLSDFRIYSTALSEKDVKELYNTSAIINNNNTLESYEFVEGTTYNINKSGVMTGKEFTEHNEEVLINNTEQVFATEFIEI